jgi:hypothetical protein
VASVVEGVWAVVLFVMVLAAAVVDEEVEVEVVVVVGGGGGGCTRVWISGGGSVDSIMQELRDIAGQRCATRALERRGRRTRSRPPVKEFLRQDVLGLFLRCVVVPQRFRFTLYSHL